MFSRTTLLILLSLVLFSNGCSFGKRSRIRDHQSNEKCECTTTARYNFPKDSNVTVDPYCNCMSSDFGIVQIIPYSTCITDKCDAIYIDLSSACVRCNMCMAVADKINQTLLETHDMMMHDDWLNETEIIFFLRTICDYSFQHYGLREIDGKRFISDPVAGDKFISSSIDGLWEKNLKNMCHEYLNEIQELQLYKKWKNWCENKQLPNLEDNLCRNKLNNLQDCRGLDSIHKQRVSTIFNARVKFLAKYI